MLAGVEEVSPANKSQSRTPSPVYDELHEIISKLFREMTVNELTEPDNVFRTDILLMALKKDFYVFQRDVRGYSPESFLEQLCLTFFPQTQKDKP